MCRCSLCIAKCKGCCSPFITKCKAAFEKARVPSLIASLIVFAIDVITDGNAFHIYYSQGDFVWAGLTLLFMLLPMVVTSVGGIYNGFIKSDGGDNDARPWLVKAIFMLGAVMLAPLVVVILLVWGVVKSIQGDDDAANALGLIKLTESMLEALPQTCLTSYIMAQYLLDDTKTIGAFQWVTLAASILSLTLAIATNKWFHANASAISRAVFFGFGMLSVVARIMICCILSQVAKPLWLLPIGTALAITVAIWIVKRCCKWSWPVPLSTALHYTANPSTILMEIPMSFILTTVFNSFSMSGLPIASATLAYAIGANFIIPGPLAIAAVTLAAISLLANVILVSVPAFRVVGKDWLQVNKEGKSWLI